MTCLPFSGWRQPTAGIRLFLCVLAAASVLGAPLPAAADERASVLQHGATVSAANALIAEVRVSLDRAARMFVEYDNPVAGRYRTALSGPSAEHVIPIVRLRPETTYDYTVFVAGGEEAAAGPGGRFTTGALPPSMTERRVRATGRSSQPLILSIYRRHTPPGGEYVIWDATGATVWYHHGIAPAGPIRQLTSGNFVFFEPRKNLTEITPLGEVVNVVEEAGGPHHELTVLDDGRLIYPGRTDQVDNLRIWDPATGRIEQVWDANEAWDVRDPERVLWTRINSVTIGPRGNFILSSRTRGQVVSLSPDFRTIAWQLSGPDSDFEFPNPADRFYAQHTATQLANGNVLVFDNGRRRPEAEGGEYSRALELRLDAAAGTAVKVWEYRHTPDVYSHRAGSAYRLRNGNTLVNFSTVEDHYVDAPLITVEVDAAGAEVFRVETFDARPPGDRSRYRTYGGVTAIMGETVLRPPS